MLRLLVASIAGLVSFFLFFWLFTWITGNNNTGALLAIPLGFLGSPILVLRIWRNPASKCPEGKGLYPECMFVVTVESYSITNKRPDGSTEHVATSDLAEISILTNSSGPLGADVWWLFVGAHPNTGCAFPGGATGEQEVLKWAQQLPGFDNDAFIKAMGSTSEARFLCWSRQAQQGTQDRRAEDSPRLS